MGKVTPYEHSWEHSTWTRISQRCGVLRSTRNLPIGSATSSCSLDILLPMLTLVSHHTVSSTKLWSCFIHLQKWSLRPDTSSAWNQDHQTKMTFLITMVLLSSQSTPFPISSLLVTNHVLSGGI